MTTHEKAVNAINARLERLQSTFRDAQLEASRQAALQSIIVTIGVAGALEDYIRMVGAYARRRHGEVKQANDALAAQHAQMLQSGRELLEKLKLDPADTSVRKEIEGAQRNMASVQKALRGEANALQRELAPCLALIDQAAVSVRQFSEADDSVALKRLVKAFVEHVRDLYAAQTSLSAKNVIDAAAWEKSALAEIDQAGGFQDAYTRVGYQAVLALELMALAISETPPGAADEAIQRGIAAVAARLQEVTKRFAAGGGIA